MNITTQVTTVKCNFCQAVIPAAGQNGAARLANTAIDACSTCAQEAFVFLAPKFTAPPAPKPALQKVKLANGSTVMMPQGAALPQGASLVNS